MLKPNAEQIKAILQMLLGTGGPAAALILSYGVPADKLNLWVNLILAIAPPVIAGIWAAIDNTHKQTIAAAASVPGVSEVVVSSDAKDGAAAAAADPTLTNVNKGG
jgi:hypothetical protein